MNRLNLGSSAVPFKVIVGMDATLYLFLEDKDKFIEVNKISSQDVIFIVDNDDNKVIIWQGLNSTRVQRYKAGMKVATLISQKRLYNFKSEIMTEGEESPSITEFLAEKFGKRDLSPVEIARDDRKQVESKAKKITDRYSQQEPKAAKAKLIAPSKQRASQKPSLSKPTTIKTKKEQESTEIKTRLIPVPKKTEKPSKFQSTTIKDELRRVNLGMGRQMAETDNIALDKKKYLSKDERQVLDDVKREQSRSDNIASIQEKKLMDEEKRKQQKNLDAQRKRQLDAGKRKVEQTERERIKKENQFLEEKLRREKEEMEQIRLEREEALKEEGHARQEQIEAQAAERESSQEEVVEFEMRKLDLRIQVRRKGVGYIKKPTESSHKLYRIEQGVAVTMYVEYLTMGDVYLLDNGSDIFVWNGRLATLDEKFFGAEIAKMLKEARGAGTKINIIEQAAEPAEFIMSFKSLMILDGNYADSILKKENVQSVKDFIVYRIKTESGLLFMEMPKDHASITSNDSFLFDFGNMIIVWHGKDSNPEERQKSDEIADAFKHERDPSVKVKVVDEGPELSYDQFPPEVWVILKGEERAAELEAAYNRAMNAIEKQRSERELKKQQEKEAKQLVEKKKSIGEMERIERELLQKEINRKKGQLTPQQIEEKWSEFRRKMRVRRGLPEEEPVAEPELESGELEEELTEDVQETLVVDEAAEKKQKEREFEQLKRIELDMLNKKIQRDKPSPDVEAKLRADLQKKLDDKWNSIQAKYE